jgi:hypothetical protein
MPTTIKELSKLEGLGLGVERLAEFHYRVAARFDVFPNQRNFYWKWHDIVTQKRGTCWAKDLHSFVPGYLKSNPAPGPIVIRQEKGWWNCPMQGCAFKMRDDGSAISAARISAHMESH